jgi:hypothetical protein
MRYLFLLSIISLFISGTCKAQDDGFYGVLTAGYAQNETDFGDLDAASYKLALAYVWTKQWSVEAGFQSVADKRLEVHELNQNNASQELNTVFIAALGKAGNRYGELFYRLGLARAKITTDFLDSNPACALPSAQAPSQLMLDEGLNLCRNDSTIVAGIVGIGFDMYIHHKTLLRLEFERLQGEDGFTSNVAYLGFRLNF